MKSFHARIFVCLGLHLAALTILCAPPVLAQGNTPVVAASMSPAGLPAKPGARPVGTEFHEPEAIEFAQYADPFSMSNSPSFDNNSDSLMYGSPSTDYLD